MHGTGIKAGDPCEMGAVSQSLAAGRPPGAPPLYCGSVKTNIGHLEAAACLAGVIKCVLAMERGVIPPHLNLATPKLRLRLDASGVGFHSTVRGRQVAGSELTADYWVANLCSTVELVLALDDMLGSAPGQGSARSRSKLPSVVKVGPHGALGGPFKQFKLARAGTEHVEYHSLL